MSIFRAKGLMSPAASATQCRKRQCQRLLGSSILPGSLIRNASLWLTDGETEAHTLPPRWLDAEGEPGSGAGPGSVLVPGQQRGRPGREARRNFSVEVLGRGQPCSVGAQEPLLPAQELPGPGRRGEQSSLATLALPKISALRPLWNFPGAADPHTVEGGTLQGLVRVALRFPQPAGNVH